MRNKLCILIFASLVLLSSCNLFPQTPPTMLFSNDDAEMNAAIQNAKDTLPLFIKALQSPKPSQTDFSIKAKFPYGDGSNFEHIWITDLVYENNQFEGIVDNEPSYVQTIHSGDTVKVQISDVTDWIIIDDNKLLGGFTVFVERKHMTDKEREKFDYGTGVIFPDKPALP